MRTMILLTLMECIASVGLAQEQPLADVIDIHMHSAPDTMRGRLMQSIWPAGEGPGNARAGAEESL